MVLKNKSLFLASLMLLAAGSSAAISLGRHRGATLIGRPLDLSVQAVLDAQDDVASLCLDADVFYADTKLDKSRVRVTAEKATSGTQDAVIRIRSSSLVDEPVVTVYLRVGCQQKTERRYVTLADLASDATPDRNAASSSVPLMQISPPSVALPATAPSPVNVPGFNSGSAGAAKSSDKPTRKSKRSAKPADAANQDATVPGQTVSNDNTSRPTKSTSSNAERTQGSAAGKTSVVNRSRLKLEPLDLTIDRNPQLKSSAELLSSPSESSQERSAAAALWRAIAAQPQDIVKEFDKLQTLESSVRSLQAESQKNQQAINQLDSKLQKTESERYANVLVYGLVLLLLLALAGLAYLLRERLAGRGTTGGDTPWWRKKDTQNNWRGAWADSAAQGASLGKGRHVVVKKAATEVSIKEGLSVTEMDVNLARSDLSSFGKNSTLDADSSQSAGSKFTSDFALSMTHPTRAVKAEELFDVQQQADFFVSIGQHDQAIEVLRSHIADTVETSALVYLDLFNLYHQLQLKEDYAVLREEFNLRFNTKIPVFDMYTDAGPGLEAYQTALSRIEALWPSSKVLELIEESIFRRPETNAEAFNLEAYRELLMLYSVAKEITSPVPTSAAKPPKFDLPEIPADRPDSRPPTFMSTAIQPLSASIGDLQPLHPGALLEPMLFSTVPPASLNLGLDLDLSQPMPGASFSESAGGVDVSDADFFAQFDKEANADALPHDAGSVVARKQKGNDANLMDFDSFDAALGASDKFKPPKN